MDKITEKAAKGMGIKRKIIQLYSALLYNAYLKGFIKGEIFTGISKNVCVPGFNCYSCPGAVGACPLGSLQNALAASSHRLPFYVLGILMLFGLILGRTVCGWLCPIGLLQEVIYKIPTFKLKKSRITKVLSYLKYVILIYFVIAIPIIHISDGIPVPGFCKYICPVGTLEGAIGLLSHPANQEKLSMLGILFTRKAVIMVAIFTAAIFIFRFFCRFICPLGAIYGIFSRVTISGVKVNNDKCTHCGLCVAACRMDVSRVGDHECIHCGECVSVCPHGAITVKPSFVCPSQTSNKKRIISILIATLVLAGVLIYANYPSESTAASSDSENQSQTSSLSDMVGTPSPEFEVALYNNEGSFSLADCMGKPTVINFWATWCGGCCAELPDYQKIYEKYGDDINMIAVHSSLITDDVVEFIDNSGYSFTFGQDEDDMVYHAFGGTNMLPQTVILDSDGIIVYNGTKTMDYETLDALISPMLGNE